MDETNVERKRTLIFVCGKLKRRFHNHALMLDLISRNDAVFVGTHLTVPPYRLVCGPHNIPYLINVPGPGHRIRGELYSVTGRGLGPLDDFEGVDVGHYERLPISFVRVRGGVVSEAEAHFAHRSFGVGQWERNDRKGMRKYSKRYLKRHNRPHNGRSILEDARLFVASSSSYGN